MNLSATFVLAQVKRPQFDPDYIWGVYIFQTKEAKGTNQTFKAVGVLPKSALHFGLPIELRGNWQNTQYGRQFAFTHCMVEHPSGQEGMEAFLQQAPGIGPSIAAKLWEWYGEEAPKQCLDQGDKVIQALHSHKLYVKSDVMQAAGQLYAESEAEARHLLPLVTLLSGVRFSHEIPKWAIKHLAGDPVQIISTNPFILMDAPRASFTLCDQLRIKLGLPEQMPERYAAAMLSIFQERNSDTWLDKRYCIDQLCQLIGSTASEAVQAIVQLLETKQLVTHEGYLALHREAQVEQAVCEKIVDFSNVVGNWYPVEAGAHLSAHQLEHLHCATENGQIAVLLGSAGTGKTHTAAAVVQSFGSQAKIIACAPTGKAAQRLTAGFNNLGIQLRAETIHRTLQAIPRGNSWTFRIDGTTQMLEGDLLIVDEVGMVTNHLLYSLLRTVPRGMPVLCLGDPHQLPPIGRGTFLRDWQLICQEKSDKFQIGLLTEVHRNAGLLEHLCAKITQGITPTFPKFFPTLTTFDPDSNVMLYPATSDQSAKANLLRFFMSVKEETFTWPDGSAIDPTKDIQVVVPMNDNGVVSRKSLNEDLQKLLNPTKSEHSYYRPYDKVICLQNGFYPRANAAGKVYAANGEIGYVTKTEKTNIHIRMVLTEEIIRYGTKHSGNDFDKAYAVTCHKMQGDQAPIVITVLNHGFRGIMNREWLYTALTRAQKFGLVIGSQQQIHAITQKVGMWERQSFMSHWLTGKELLPWTLPTLHSQSS